MTWHTISIGLLDGLALLVTYGVGVLTAQYVLLPDKKSANTSEPATTTASKLDVETYRRNLRSEARNDAWYALGWLVGRLKIEDYSPCFLHHIEFQLGMLEQAHGEGYLDR